MQAALDLFLARAWALDGATVEAFLRVAGGDRLPPRGEAAPHLLRAAPGRPLEGTHAVTVREGVAVLPVVGPLFRRAHFFTAVSGGTSTELLARDLLAAVEAPGLRAVLLEIDSPGGEAAGIAETAALLRRLGARRPIHAYADGQCCSGAYWLAAACRSITAAPTALLGSIGVVMGFRRQRGDVVEIVSSVSPAKRPDPETEAGRAQIQQVVDDLAAVFVAEVARYRGVSQERVLRDFGGGGVLVGAKAVRAGLADAVSTQEALLRRLGGDGVGVSGAGKETAMDDETTLREQIEALEDGRRRLEAENALLLAAETRRALLEALARKRFCEGAYALTPATREALAAVLAELTPGPREALLAALEAAELLPLGALGFPADGPAPDAPSPAEEERLQGMAARSGLPLDAVRAQFLAVRRRKDRP